MIISILWPPQILRRLGYTYDLDSCPLAKGASDPYAKVFFCFGHVLVPVASETRVHKLRSGVGRWYVERTCQ